MEKSPWIKINKGDRRPDGEVLVIYEYQEVDYGDPLNAKIDCWDMVEAYWNTRAQSWIAHGKPIRNVTYWMPLPKAPWEYNEDAQEYAAIFNEAIVIASTQNEDRQ